MSSEKRKKQRAETIQTYRLANKTFTIHTAGIEGERQGGEMDVNFPREEGAML